MPLASTQLLDRRRRTGEVTTQAVSLPADVNTVKAAARIDPADRTRAGNWLTLALEADWDGNGRWAEVCGCRWDASAEEFRYKDGTVLEGPHLRQRLDPDPKCDGRSWGGKALRLRVVSSAGLRYDVAVEGQVMTEAQREATAPANTGLPMP